MATDPQRSAGARLERKAIRTYIRRLQREAADHNLLEIILRWVLQRQQRYNRRKGGLGR